MNMDGMWHAFNRWHSLHHLMLNPIPTLTDLGLHVAEMVSKAKPATPSVRRAPPARLRGVAGSQMA